MKRILHKVTLWTLAMVLSVTVLNAGGLIFDFLPFMRDVQAVASGDGLLVYGVSANTTPQQRTYTQATNSFGANSDTVAGSQANIVVLKASPTKKEMVAGYIDTSSNLQVMCFNGSTWSNEWSVAVGTSTQRAFNIAYETNSGDVLIVYSTNTATNNELAYRTKAGSADCGSANWSAATNYSALRTNGIIKWVELASDPRSSSNLIAITWQDGSTAPSDLSAAIWSGTAIGNEPGAALTVSLEHTTAAADTDVVEVQYEASSGDVMIVWGISTGANGTNGARYATCTGGTSTCTWSGTGDGLSVPTVSDDVTWLDMGANPASNEMVYAAVGNAGDDLTAAYWSGSAWTGFANLDISAETDRAGAKPLAASFITGGSTTRCVVQYDDATGTGISWKHQTAPCTGAWTSPADQSVTPAIDDVRDWYQSEQNPFDASELMVMISDITPAIYAKRLKLGTDGTTFTWSQPDGQASLGTPNSSPRKGYAFAYNLVIDPVLNQIHYRWRSDDGNETTGTSLQSEDTAHTGLQKNTNIRLRFTINNTGGSATNYNYRLEWALASGACDGTGESFAAVPDTPTTEPFDMTTTANYTDQTASTNVATGPGVMTDPGGSTFAAGYLLESPSNQTPNLTLAQNRFTEIEYNFQANSNAANSTTYCFRLSNAGTGLNTYTVYAEVTTGAALGPTTDQVMRHGNWFNAGVEQGFFWAD